mmetsp:Transcript_16301/g.25041  ORF Transcript_16301/g.25041 Transcript_16301/m.25041 type:complete len:239 (+) Transcript_16301:27-743(+)|eukprot:CAMPEP_0202713550 /NCGR_PEP_ID=MMETSP1385-20130828/55895_1 /ASSEMBLY_ACC=CAM_ASM_000861 /TAXON_ID=933848 /ORGANISM="Elphidium margaritaceum" /LENGTH=238 /DNA_ID=CAMNT_0049373933 /DNA_START=27 /DNA_END=743 /DNA_ORIENTATION=+
MASLNSRSTLPSTLTSNTNSMQPPPPGQMNSNYMEDTSSIAMFTAVGHVGLHLVIRPLVRWGMRSMLLPAKQYLSVNNKSKTNASGTLEAESAIENELEDAEVSTSKNKKKSRSALKTLSEINYGLASSYSEIVCTFGALAGISYTAHPSNVLLYFGITYPSLPFVLRFWHSINDKRSKITLKRTGRLIGKGLIVTSGFGVSMALVGFMVQSIPFFNIFVLAFWDCFADFLISDGPNK